MVEVRDAGVSFLVSRKQVVIVNDNLEYNCKAVGIKLVIPNQKSCQTYRNFTHCLTYFMFRIINS